MHQERFNVWARKLHSRLLQSDNWRWMIELAASWMIVMLATGVYLWWPRRGVPVQPAISKSGTFARKDWRRWHALVGVTLGLLSLAILTTGLTWSKYAGGQIRALRDHVGQAPPAPPRGLQSQPGSVALDWQGAWDAVRRQAPEVAVQLIPPTDPSDVWRASAADSSQPRKRFDLQLDAYSGAPLYYAGWDKQTAFAKATAIGIPFHRGEFGWWNQALLLLFGLGVLFSLVSGWVMVFKRRRRGRLGLPQMQAGAWKSAPAGAWVAAVALCALMPLLALSAAGVVLIEIVLARGRGMDGGMGSISEEAM